MTDGSIDFDTMWQTIQKFALTSGVRLVGALLIVFVGFALVNRLIKLLKKGKGISKIDNSAKDFILGFVSVVLKVVLALTAMSVLGIPMTNVVALLGSCGLAVGLALQGSLSNFAGGLMLLIFKPFKIGDYIECDNVSGTVKDITILYTHVVTVDNKVTVVPNGTLSNAVITNFSAEDKRRYDAVIGVSYDCDTEKAKSALLEAAKTVKKILNDPAPQVMISKYGDSSIEITLRVWMKTSDYWDVLFEVNDKIKPALDECGISIPYPQIDVHLDR